MRGIFVTGTDTGVGKTVACAALLHRLRATAPVRYWKPIQTGIEEDDDTATVAWLSGCSGEGVFDEGVRLPRPVSPHLAARLSGTRVTVDRLMAIREPLTSVPVIVEGAGGVLVPLNEEELIIDLVRRLELPVVLVARSSLGTINHTLLSLEALRSRGQMVAGVIMVGERNHENRQAIEHHGRVAVLGELSRLMPLTPETLQDAATELDPHGLLYQHFGIPGESP